MTRELQASARAVHGSKVLIAPADVDKWRKFWLLVLVMSVIQFTGAWIYPPSRFAGTETLITEKALGVPFQYTLWLMMIVGMGMHIQRSGLDFAAKSLAPWLPFFVAGLTASVLGVAPFTSLRAIFLWVFCVIGAYISAAELPKDMAFKAIFRTLAVMTVLSALAALLIPALGTTGEMGSQFWRGVYTNKNQLGWISSLFLLIAVGMHNRARWKITTFVVLVAIACLWKSGSKGALMACLITFMYLGLVSLLRSKVTPALGVAAVSVALFSFLVFGFFVLPALLAVLGKDPTFTGRTFIWSSYLNSMFNSPFFGEGPASYTYLSELTAPLAMRLVRLGAIVTPHNAFLGAFGDGGIFGLLSFAGVLLYLAIVSPFLRNDRATLICAGVAFLNMAHGMVETHEVFSAGFGWFLMVFFRTLSLRQQERNGQDVGAAPSAQAIASRAGH